MKLILFYFGKHHCVAGIVMSLPTTSNNNEDRMFYKKARNGREDTLDFTIEESQLEGLRDSLDDRGSGGQDWLGLGPGLGRSIVNSERKGEIKGEIKENVG